jgi:prophage maintenance system killer protein
MSEIIIYQTKDNQTELNVRIEDETVWLSQSQMAKLFIQSKQNISLHINNCFKEKELVKEATVKESLTVQKEGKRTVKRMLEYYNLDVIISVGYRIKSLRGTQFRQWATQRLKDYIVQGYVVNQKRLAEREMEIQQLKSGISILRRSIDHQAHNLSDAKRLATLLENFSNGLDLLDDFDHSNLDQRGKSKKKVVPIQYNEYIELIDFMRSEFSTTIFGKEKDESFQSSITQIYQSFNGKDLYPTLEEKAATLLYLIVKNHSFVDGNKRIAAACFLLFLEKNKILYDSNGASVLSNDALAAVTLYIAESKPEEMKIVKQLVISILNRNIER